MDQAPRPRFSRLWRAASLGLAVSLAACGSDVVQPDETYPSTYEVSISPPLLFLGVEKRFQMSFELLDSIGAFVPGATFSFSSDNAAVLTVTDSGLARATGGPGDAVVTVRAKNLSARAVVRVLPTLPIAGRSVLQGSASTPPFGIAIYGNTILATQLSGGNVGSVSRAVLPGFAFGPPLLWGGDPRAVVFDSGGTRAFVAGTPGRGVTTIALPSGAVIDSLPTFTFSDDAFDAVLSADGHILYVATADGKIFALNTDSLPDARILVALNKVATHIIKHPALPMLYVSGGTTVDEVNSQTGAVTRSFSFGSQALGIAVSPDGSRLYVALVGFGDVGSLIVWDLRANGLIRSVDAYGGLFHIARTPSGNRLFVSVASLGKLYVFSTANLDFTSMYEVGGSPARLAMTADGATVAVANLEGWVDFIR